MQCDNIYCEDRDQEGGCECMHPHEDCIYRILLNEVKGGADLIKQDKRRCFKGACGGGFGMRTAQKRRSE